MWVSLGFSQFSFREFRIKKSKKQSLVLSSTVGVFIQSDKDSTWLKNRVRECSYWGKCLITVTDAFSCLGNLSHNKETNQTHLLGFTPADWFPRSILRNAFCYVFGAFRFTLRSSICKRTSHGHVLVILSGRDACFCSGERYAKTNLSL